MNERTVWVTKTGDAKVSPSQAAQWERDHLVNQVEAELRAAGVDLDAIAKAATSAPEWDDQAAKGIAQRFPGGRWLLNASDHLYALEGNLVPRAGMRKAGAVVLYASPESWSEEYARKSSQTVADLVKWARKGYGR